MKLQTLDKITKKHDAHLYYRNEYSAVAFLVALDGRNVQKKIEFSIEMAPSGKKEIKVEFVEKVDYPVLHILKSLKEEIQELDRKGLLH